MTSPSADRTAGEVRRGWNWQRATAIAVGGVAGAALRWAVVSSLDAGSFPWPVLMVNVAGSLLLGVLLAEEWSHPSRRVILHDAGGIGFCGGVTTFSTFSLEVVNLVRSDELALAVLYVLTSVVGTVAGVAAGAAAARHVRAVALPLEEQP